MHHFHNAVSLVLACSLGSAVSFQIAARQPDLATRALGLSLHRHNIESTRSPPLRRRSGGYINEAAESDYHRAYSLHVSLGTPPQKLRLFLDTGSADTWITQGTLKVCDDGASHPPTLNESTSCSQTGEYMPSDSSSFHNLSLPFNIDFVDGRGTHNGFYATDTFTVSNATLHDFQFGVGVNTRQTGGVLGIGFPELEGTVTRNNGSQYPNLPGALHRQGLIQSALFSVSLTSRPNVQGEGELLFGAVDVAKFHGPLQSLPGIDFPDQGGHPIAVVGAQMKRMTFSSNDTTTTLLNKTTPILLDLGSEISYMDDSVATALLDALQLSSAKKTDTGHIICPCSLANSSATVQFQFGHVVIPVTMSEFILNPLDPQYPNSCILGIQSTSDSGLPPHLGLTVLRSMYLVVDQDSRRVAVAPANFHPGPPDIREIVNHAGSAVLNFSAATSTESVGATTTTTMTTTSNSTSISTTTTISASTTTTTSANVTSTCSQSAHPISSGYGSTTMVPSAFSTAGAAISTAGLPAPWWIAFGGFGIAAAVL